jgi:hypothetical protein
MPILDESHDRAHPVEGDVAWSESYYFNGFDPASDTGLFTRIGIRPNEGTMDVGMSVWLPDGELAEYRAVKEQREMVDTDLVVGDVRYEMLKPMSAWRITMDGVASARPCVRGSASSRDVPISLDLRFDAISPPIGTDGQGSGPRTAEAAAASGSVGRGHLEQSGSWSGWLVIDGKRVTWSHALGNRDRSWGPRRWGGPKMWRWFSINVDDDLNFGGIQIGTDAGDLNRGWVVDGGRPGSVAEWRLKTELADDDVTHSVVNLQVLIKDGRTYDLRGDVMRVADIGRAGGTMVNEGLTRWTYVDAAGTERVGYGIAEYLHQLDDRGRPVVPVE